jgi:serine/threonine protein kinase
VEAARDVERDELVVAKLEHNTIFPSAIDRESDIYLQLGIGRGFPKVFTVLNEAPYKVMILEYLGPDLADLLEFCGRRFSLKTTLMLIDQILPRIEHVHSKGILHRDLKPENLLMGRGRSGNVVYLTDFGISDPCYEGSVEGDPDQIRKIGVIVGSHRFASVRSHQRRSKH